MNIVGTGIFTTTDQGVSYQHVGLPAASIHSLAVSADPAGEPQLLAGTSFATFTGPLPAGRTVDLHTRDWGITGNEATFDTRIWTLAADPAHPRIAYRAQASSIRGLRLARTDDGGATWTSLLTSQAPATAANMLVDPVDPDIVYLTVTDSISSGVMVSHDGGQTWRDNHTPLALSAIAADPHDPNRIWLGGPSGLYRSDDQGQTLTRLSSTPVTALALDPRNPAHLLIGGHGLYDSHDSGHTLRAAHTSGARLNISQLLFAPDGTVYASDDQYADPSGLPVGGRGVLASRDGGRSYTSLSAGLPDLNVESLAASPGGRWLYAGTGSGSVYRLGIG